MRQLDGFRRKPLILPIFASFCQFLPTKKDSMSRKPKDPQPTPVSSRAGLGNPAYSSSKAHAKAGFIGFRRKPLILSLFVSFCQLLSAFVGKKKILWPKPKPNVGLATSLAIGQAKSMRTKSNYSKTESACMEAPTIHPSITQALAQY